MSEAATRETVERTVKFLVNPTANFISLVGRGANQTPFRVVKSITEGETTMPKILQAVIAPKGMSRDEMSAIFTAETQSLLKFDKSFEHGPHVSYEQLPREACKADSFELVVLDAKKDVKGLRAEPLESKAPGLLTRLFKAEERPQEAIALPDEIPVVDTAVAKAQYAEACFAEVYTATDAIRAILAQERGEPGQKLQMVKAVLGNLEMFLEETLTVTKEEALNMPKPEDAQKDEAKQSEAAPVVPAAETSGAPSVQEDTTAAVTATKTADGTAEEAKKSADAPDPVLAKLEELAKTVSTLGEAVAKMQQQVPTITSRVSDPIQKAADKPGDFTGLLFK